MASTALLHVPRFTASPAPLGAHALPPGTLPFDLHRRKPTPTLNPRSPRNLPTCTNHCRGRGSVGSSIGRIGHQRRTGRGGCSSGHHSHESRCRGGVGSSSCGGDFRSRGHARLDARHHAGEGSSARLFSCSSEEECVGAPSSSKSGLQSRKAKLRSYSLTLLPPFSAYLAPQLKTIARNRCLPPYTAFADSSRALSPFLPNPRASPPSSNQTWI